MPPLPAAGRASRPLNTIASTPHTPPDHVYGEIKRAAKDAMLKLVEAEREGEQIDRSLLKNVLAIACGIR